MKLARVPARETRARHARRRHFNINGRQSERGGQSAGARAESNFASQFPVFATSARGRPSLSALKFPLGDQSPGPSLGIRRPDVTPLDAPVLPRRRTPSVTRPIGRNPTRGVLFSRRAGENDEHGRPADDRQLSSASHLGQQIGRRHGNTTLRDGAQSARLAPGIET